MLIMRSQSQLVKYRRIDRQRRTKQIHNDKNQQQQYNRHDRHCHDNDDDNEQRQIQNSSPNHRLYIKPLRSKKLLLRCESVKA